MNSYKSLVKQAVTRYSTYMTNTVTATGPVRTRSYVQTSHMHHEMVAADGTVVAHRYEHIVSGYHYVTEYTPDNQFPGVKHVQHGTELDAKRAWVKLYNKYN